VSLPGRVLFVITHYHPAIGGAEGQARRLAEGLVGHGYAVDVLTGALPGAPALEEIGGVRVHRAIRVVRRRGLWGASHYLTSLRFLLRAGRRYGAVVGFQLQSFHNPAALAWARRTGGRVIVRGSGTGAEGDLRELARMPSGRWILGSLKRAAALVALTGEMGAQMAAAGLAPERVHVIPNGVDTGFFRPAAGGPDAPPALLYLGRLIPYKGLPDLGAAFAELAAGRRDLVLQVCGDGPERAALAAQLGGLGLADRVRFAGWVGDPRPALAAAAAVVLPTLGEGMSNVLLEALACGRPVVTTDLPANRAVVEEGVSGLLVRPGDPPALAAAIRRVLDEPGLAGRLGDGARRRAVEHFSLAAACGRYRDLLASLGVAPGAGAVAS
jgi:glycosyltransferase involved in cell wall biosynthesis